MCPFVVYVTFRNIFANIVFLFSFILLERPADVIMTLVYVDTSMADVTCDLPSNERWWPHLRKTKGPSTELVVHLECREIQIQQFQ